MNDGLAALWVLLLFVVLFVAMFGLLIIPAIIAFRRQHPNRWPILALCLFLGATGIGWAVALIWALHAAHRPADGEGSTGGESGLNVFVNDMRSIASSDSRGAPIDRADQSMTSPVDGVLQQIERLEKLRSAGHIDDAEFATLKAAALKEL